MKYFPKWQLWDGDSSYVIPAENRIGSRERCEYQLICADPGRQGRQIAEGWEIGRWEKDWFVNVALDNFCEGTRVGGIELLLDLSLKQNVMEKLHFGFWGIFLFV